MHNSGINLQRVYYALLANGSVSKTSLLRAMIFHQFIFVYGLAVLTSTLFAALRSIFQAIKLYVYARFVVGKPLRTYGKWAVITGGSEGIGLAMAEEIAKCGLNICFIARNEEEMGKIIQYKIQKECNIETRVIIADLSDTFSYKYIQSVVEEIDDIGILVNCAEISHGSKPIVEIDPKDCLDLITTNVSATVWLIRTVAPKMIANRRGLVLNFGSMTSELILPRISVYAGSKSFISNLTESLEHELRTHNIHVKYIMPGFVGTKMVHNCPVTLDTAKLTPWALLSPESYAKSVVESLKIADSPRVIFGHLYYWLYYHATRLTLFGADNRAARIDFLISFLFLVKGIFLD